VNSGTDFGSPANSVKTRVSSGHKVELALQIAVISWSSIPSPTISPKVRKNPDFQFLRSKNFGEDDNGIAPAGWPNPLGCWRSSAVEDADRNRLTWLVPVACFHPSGT
jgi:hypothetical protein